MPVTMQHDRDNIFRVELRGTLRKTELEQCQQQLKTEMDRLGAVKLLFVLAGFDGWERGASWNDLSFTLGTVTASNESRSSGPNGGAAKR